MDVRRNDISVNCFCMWRCLCPQDDQTDLQVVFSEQAVKLCSIDSYDLAKTHCGIVRPVTLVHPLLFVDTFKPLVRFNFVP